MRERSWGIVSLALTLLAACSSGTTKPPADGFDRQALLRDVGAQVILPTYEAFEGQATALSAAVGAWSSAVSTGSAEAGALRDDARVAFASAMAVWQRAEVLQVGPAGSASSVTGGRDLRSRIYSWPTVSPCRVDQELVAERYAAPTFFDDTLVNAYGFDALEYLLFSESFENACPSQVDINQNGSWAALSPDEITEGRAAYATRLAVGIRDQAKELADAWRPSAGDYLGRFAAAGGAGSQYGTAQAALNELFAAIFYLDLRTKDLKLAVPAGISPDCTREICPELAELHLSRGGATAIVANLESFQAVILGASPGTDAVGFDDWLIELGAPEVATSLVDKTQAALAASRAIDGTLEEALVADLDDVQTTHAAVKAVTDLLKSQVISVLALEVPQEGAADND